MANILKKDRQLQVIHLLCEGNSLRSIERLTGVQKKTVARLTVRFGEACRQLLDTEMRGLTLRHVQCDEIWTYVLKKQARIHVDDRHTQTRIGDQFLYIALDEDTKLVPSFALGKRTGELTYRFMLDLYSRLVMPKPHASDNHAFAEGSFQAVTQISTDAFQHYPPAIAATFGPYARYGQLIKDYRNAQLPYTPSEIIGARRIPYYGTIDPWSICTSHVERGNLTIRTFMKRFARLTLGFSKKFENLAAAVAIHVAHYNFVRRHSSLRMTPAMAANVTGTLWSIEDLYDRAMGGIA